MTLHGEEVLDGEGGLDEDPGVWNEKDHVVLSMAKTSTILISTLGPRR